MDDLLTTRQLQALLHVDRITIYRMLGDGRLAGFKVGGQWRFARSQIESWLQEQQGLPSPTMAASSSTDNLPLSCVQAVLSVYAEAMDVAAVTTDPEGTPLAEISGSRAFCNLILGTDEGWRRCIASWRVPKGGRRSQTAVLRPCHAGLLCASMPVLLHDRWVACVAACQFAPLAVDGRTEWQPDLRALADGLGLDEHDLRAALPTIPLLNDDQLARVERLLARVADTVCEMSQERANMRDRLQRIAKLTNL